MPRLHADELPIDSALVRRLVDRTFPEYVDDELRQLADSGSSNVLFRLGDDKLVRLPRQPGGGAVIEREARWLPHVAGRVTVDVPAVLGIGEPDLGYPERWAVTTWLDGTRPAVPGPDARGGGTDRLADDLARFLTELRAIEVPPGAEHEDELVSYRGLSLYDVDEDFRDLAAECRALGVGLDIDDALRVWDEALDASRSMIEPTNIWYHGDLLVENLLLNDSGGLAAVIDFGGLAVGNPTVDLVVAWEALDAAGRRVLRTALDIDDATWTTSRGWALFIAMVTFPYYGKSMVGRCADRLAMAKAAIAGS